MLKPDAKRCIDVSDRYPQLEKEIKIIRRADPTNQLCTYMEWLVKAYLRKEYMLEDIQQVKEDLALFHKNKNRFTGRNKDINSFTYSSLKIFLSDTFNPKVNTIQLVKEDKDKKILYDGPLGTLIIPLTQQGSCEAGSGTKWCTAAKYNNMFDRYNKDGNLYIWIDKHYMEKKELFGGSKKFQFHFSTGQYMDEYDNAISPELFRYFREEHPIVSQLFKDYERKIIEERDLDKVYDYYTRSKDLEWKEGSDFIKRTPKLAYKYAKEVKEGRWPEAEPFFGLDPYYATLYSYNIANGASWNDLIGDPSIDQAMMRDPRSLSWISINIKKDRWPEVESFIVEDASASAEYAAVFFPGERWLEAENNIAKSRKDAISYIKDNLDMRWIEVEDLILSKEAYLEEGGKGDDWNLNIASDIIWYSRCYLHQRWYKAEPLLNDEISYYLWHVVQGHDEELYQRMLKIGEIDELQRYADEVIKGRLPEEVEYKLLSATRAVSLDYTIKYIKQRVPVLEKSLISYFLESIENGEFGDDDDDFIQADYVEYAIHCIQGRWINIANEIGSDIASQIEDMILSEPTIALKYNIAFLKIPMANFESSILPTSNTPIIMGQMGRPKLAVQYQRFILKKRWREAEKLIVTSPDAIVMQCIEVFKSRWPVETAQKGMLVYTRESIEAFLLNNPVAGIRYAIAFFPEGWKELDAILLKVSSYIYRLADAIVDYCIHCRIGRWIALEHLILQDIGAGVRYADKVIKGRWIELEKLIQQSGTAEDRGAITRAIVDYCKSPTIGRGRWYEIELLLKRNAFLGYTSLEEYGRDVVKGNWLEVVSYN